MRSLRQGPAIVLVCCWAWASALAQSETQPSEADAADDGSALTLQQLRELSLKDLLDVKVTIATKTEEKLSDAPAGISSYNAQDIKTLGYYTLADLANITAGYSSTVMYGERIFETRGQKAGSFNNNKHLVYFDGIPVNHARSYKAPADEELPLFVAQRTEFLRGPASALYGTSAFFGAINVVPKTLQQNGMSVENRVTAGSRDGLLRLASNALYRGRVGTFRLSVGYFDKAASRDFVGVVNSLDNRYWDDQKSAFLNLSYRIDSGILEGLSAAVLFMRKNGGMGEHWMENATTHQLNDLTWETLIPYLKYQKRLGAKVQLDAYLMWNRGTEKGWWTALNASQLEDHPTTGGLFQAYDARVDAVQGQAEVRWNPFHATEVIAGTNIDSRRQAGAPLSYAYSVSADPGPAYPQDLSFARGSDRYTIFSAYAQLRQELPILRGLLATLGAREDLGHSPTQNYNQLSPRAGLVQRVTPHWNLKAFYGAALRAPGLKEIELNRESKASLAAAGLPTTGVKDVTAETIKSLDVGTTYNLDRVAASFTFFRNQTRNALDGGTFEGVNIFQNTPGSTNARGVEVEAQVRPIDDLLLRANYSWALARSPSGRTPQDVPTHKINAAASYTVRPIKLTATLVGRYITGWRVIDPATTTPPGGFALVDANLVWSFSRYADLELQVRNLLNRRVKLPKNGLPDVPLPGASYFATLAFGF